MNTNEILWLKNLLDDSDLEEAEKEVREGVEGVALSEVDRSKGEGTLGPGVWNSSVDEDFCLSSTTGEEGVVSILIIFPTGSEEVDPLSFVSTYCNTSVVISGNSLCRLLAKIVFLA